uniref:Uncharacterized protein orf324 n=1 Tax=Beta vulgaris subsp. vulgaris TaxID=3555 RepID=Q34009_BETVV|nr:hypothetical protein [Beta vulgaris subsp. vulgaris]
MFRCNQSFLEKGLKQCLSHALLVNNQPPIQTLTTISRGLTEFSCLEGRIQNQNVLMPQLDQFTYVTQFLWSCLFFRFISHFVHRYAVRIKLRLSKKLEFFYELLILLSGFIFSFYLKQFLHTFLVHGLLCSMVVYNTMLPGEAPSPSSSLPASGEFWGQAPSPGWVEQLAPAEAEQLAPAEAEQLAPAEAEQLAAPAAAPVDGPQLEEPYPYADDQVIGGDTPGGFKDVFLKDTPPFPPSEVIDLCRIEAQDLMEVKAAIINKMAPWDQGGDWMGTGARALDNPRSATGEDSLENLYKILEDLKETGPLSESFSKLQNKVRRLP